MVNATPKGSSSVARGGVGRGLRGVARGKGNQQNFPAKRTIRSLPGVKVGTSGPTFDGLNGGTRPTGFVGRLRSGATIRV